MDKIVHDSKILSSDINKATCLNDFFHSVFSPAKDTVKLFTLLEPLLATKSVMPLVELRVNYIESLLKNIDETKAPGPDGISPHILKCCAWSITCYLYLI